MSGRRASSGPAVTDTMRLVELVRFRSLLCSALIDEFARQESAGKLTLKHLAQRIGRTPDEVFAGLTGGASIDLLSDICVGMRIWPRFTLAPMVAETVAPGPKRKGRRR